MNWELKSLIAQTYLLELGFYEGKLDGDWGPLSIAAAEKWNEAEALKAIPPASPGTRVPGSATPFDIARTYLGVKEIPGVKNNPLIVRWGRKLATWWADDETAWCSVFVNECADEAGYERSGKLNARSWMDVGMPVTLTNAKRGDVIVFWRGDPQGWEGHVTFLDSYDPNTGTLRCLGGNQGDEVCFANFSTDRVLGIRRLRKLDTLQGGSNKI